jgi:DNA polymerase-4
MDAFFVSVEELRDPSLKGKPVVVGGKGPERGVVSAASYTARKFGVHSALPLRTAYQLCPQAIFLEGNPKLYRDYSQKVHEVMRQFSPKVEQVSIDEAYLDMSGTERLLGRPLAAAHRLHEAVTEETALPCSIGIGTSRLVAKMCSDLAKPNGVLSVEPGAEAAFLAPLEGNRIPGGGQGRQGKLKEMGIRRIGQLQGLDDKALGGFGKWVSALAAKARGEDGGGWFDHEVGARELPKSISHETTFGEDTTDTVLIDATLAKLVQLVARRLREHGLWSRTIQIKLRYTDFTTLTRAKTLDETTQLDNVILETVRQLFRENWSGRKVRLLGVQAGSLTDPAGQLGLLDEDVRKKWGGLLAAADKLRDRFGESAVGLAGAMKHGRRERIHENPAGLPGKKKDEG